MVQNFKAVLLVGGLGTRLRSVVAGAPKVLASVGKTSFLECWLNSLVRAEFAGSFSVAVIWQIRSKLNSAMAGIGTFRLNTPEKNSPWVRRAQSKGLSPTCLINGGVYVFSQAALQSIPQAPRVWKKKSSRLY